eukprot:gene14491-biopygen12637
MRNINNIPLGCLAAGGWLLARNGESLAWRAEYPLEGSTRLGSQDTDTGVARAWRGRGAGLQEIFDLGGADVARAWRGRGAGMSCDPWGEQKMTQQGGIYALQEGPLPPVPPFPLWRRGFVPLVVAAIRWLL